MKVMEEVEPGPIEIAEDAQEVRAKLIEQVPDALRNRRFNAVLLSAATLADSFGCLGEGPRESVCWIMMMQSIIAREWLLHNWTDSLNPKSEIAASLRRLDELESANFPSKDAKPQIYAELAFLQDASPAWRRLNVEADPAAILGKMAPSTAVLCLQICPTQTAIYIAAGIPEVGDPESPYRASGTWNMMKMDLTEHDRRLLLTLVLQQRKWCEDVSKFVAMFGEQVTREQDLVGFDAAFGSKVMKSERALEERIRALTSDMEQVLAPAFGEGTDFYNFLKSLNPEDEQLSLQLFLDPALQDLPFEALNACSLFGGQISRDFSLHMLGHRLDKYSGVTCDASLVKTVLDPFGDDSGSTLEGFERESISQIAGHLKSEAVGSAKWTPLLSSQGLLSTQDWISEIEFSGKVSSIFLFSPGRLGSLLSPIEISALN
eukprot:GSChrysophyteH2.ASY1.ANO1.1084.1 assembled CDS